MSDDLAWFRSSYSAGNGGMCVEVAVDGVDRGAGVDGGVTRVRDSKDRGRPGLAVGREAWTAFVRYAAAAEQGL